MPDFVSTMGGFAFVVIGVIFLYQITKSIEDIEALDARVTSLETRLDRFFTSITAYDVHDNLKRKDMEDDGR